MNAFRRFEPYAYAFLRIVAGLLFLFHGLQKFGLLGGEMVRLASMRGAAAVIETVGGLLIMIGFQAAPVAFICSGEMAYAYIMLHQPRGPGRFRTAESSPLCMRSCFSTSRRAAPEDSAWTEVSDCG